MHRVDRRDMRGKVPYRVRCLVRRLKVNGYARVRVDKRKAVV